MTAVSRIYRHSGRLRPALSLVPIASVVAPASGARPASADDPLVVDAGGARVVVEQDPFRLSVTDGTGRTVLREVAHAATDTLAEPVTTDPRRRAGPTTRTRRRSTRRCRSWSAPRRSSSTRPPSGSPTCKSGTRSGTWYAAQDVEQVEHDGADLRPHPLDQRPERAPAGGPGRRRRATAPYGSGCNAVPSDGRGHARRLLRDPGRAGKQDGFFGFGGRHDRLDQRGRVLSSFVNQQNFELGHRPATPTCIPNGPAAAFYPQAMFWTTRYGFLLPQPELARFKLAADRADAWNVTASAAHLDYIVAPGAPRTLGAAR